MASDAFSAGLPKKSQLLRRRTFHAGSELGEEGPWCIMARKMACCACCRASLSRDGRWTKVVPRKSLISVHGIVLNHWKSMIASSWRSASSLSNSRSSSSGASVELSSICS